MTDRSQAFMNAVWEQRNNGNADTEEKLVSLIISLVPEFVTSYHAQNGIVVLDKNDVLQLSNELTQ